MKTLFTDEKVFGDSLAKMFTEQRRTFRGTLVGANSNCHDRLPDACAWLQIGFQFASDYFVASGIIAEEEKVVLDCYCREILVSLAQKQSAQVYSDKPSEKFLHKLFSLVDSGAESKAKIFCQFVGTAH